MPAENYTNILKEYAREAMRNSREIMDFYNGLLHTPGEAAMGVGIALPLFPIVYVGGVVIEPFIEAPIRTVQNVLRPKSYA